MKKLFFIVMYGLLNAESLCAYKVIGLVPVRNEEQLIIPCLKALSMYTDAIIVLDDASTDNTVSVVTALQKECTIVEIITKDTWLRDEPGDRNKLLAAGRKHEGTHFVVVDADELFSANCLQNNLLKNAILALKPGEILEVSWINLWRSPHQYRFDNSVWASQNVTVAFCDDGKCNYESDFIHTPRVPANLQGRKIRLEKDVQSFEMLHKFLDVYKRVTKRNVLGEGLDYNNIQLQRYLYDCAVLRDGTLFEAAEEAQNHFWGDGTAKDECYKHDMSVGLLHFQFVNWDNLLAKQAWYRCLERIRNPDLAAGSINHKYRQSKQEENLRTYRCPEEWFAGYKHFLDLSLYTKTESWQKKQVKQWFTHYGKEFFKDLDIWDINWG